VRDDIATTTGSCLPGEPPAVPAEGLSGRKARVHRAGSAEPGSADIAGLGDDVFQIDTRMAGYHGITAGYLIRSSRL
jgi:hypothetical protein